MPPEQAWPPAGDARGGPPAGAWRVGPRPGGAAMGLALAAAVGAACAGGPTAQQVERSRRELRLAATLQQEGNLPSAWEHARKALELDPRNGRAHVLLGVLYMQRRDYGNAEKHVRKGIELFEEHPDRGKELAEAQNILGVIWLHRGRIERAIRVLEAAAKDPLNRATYVAWSNLGLARYEAGEHDKALKSLQRAISIQPEFCVSYYRLGKVHFASKSFEKAERALSEALDAKGECKKGYAQRARRLRGESRARLGERQAAIADFERCVELGKETLAGKACRQLLSDTVPADAGGK